MNIVKRNNHFNRYRESILINQLLFMFLRNSIQIGVRAVYWGMGNKGDLVTVLNRIFRVSSLRRCDLQKDWTEVEKKLVRWERVSVRT